MKINKMKWYVIWTVIWISIWATFFTYWWAYDGFTSTLNWFDMAVKAKLNWIYTSGKMCTSDWDWQIQCITDVPVWWPDPVYTPDQDPNCESTFYYSTKTLDWVAWYYIQSCTNLKWATNKVWSLTTTEDFSDNPATEWQAVLQWAVNTDNATYPEPIWNWTQYIYGAGRTSTDYPAFKYCSDMWAWWRLPTKNELTSLFTIVMPSWMSYYTALPAISTYNYWSSTVNRNSTTDAWRSYFDYGHMSNGFKTNTNRVICIHD